MSLQNCASSDGAPVALATKYKCPPVAGDIVAESRRQADVEGDTAFEVAGKLKLQVKEKNRALRRSIASYEACRKT